MDKFRQDFEELSGILKGNPQFTPAMTSAMAQGPDDDLARNGFALAVARAYQQGDYAGALAVLDQARARFPFLPPPLFMLRARLLFYLLDRKDPVPQEYLDYGFQAIERGLWDLGLEAIGTALVNDTRHTMALLHDASRILAAMEHYERAAAHVEAARPPRPRAARRPGRIRIGILVSNIVDFTVAFSRRLLDFARHLDRTRFELFVYSTENACARQAQLPIMYMSHPSPERAPLSLRELAERQVPVFFADTRKPIIPASLDLARQMEQDGIDILIFQSGPHMPIDWLATRLAAIPVKIHLHIGGCVYMRGMTLTLFDNAPNMERESRMWPAYAGEQVLLRQGTDIDAIDQTPALKRADVDLPPDAVLVGVLSNRFVERLSEPYIGALIAALQACPQAWFIGIGAGGCPPAVEYRFRESGVWNRVRFLPQQRQPAGALKLLDIYANEFPAGGSQSVVEAMVCGLPVAALRAADTHHESAGADIVGPPHAIDRMDPKAYQRLLVRWINDPAARRAAGQALRQRAEQDFSIRDYVAHVCELGAARLNAAPATPFLTSGD